MIDITFKDPNINATSAFELNGCRLTAPAFTAAEVHDIVDSTSRHAEEYFSAGHGGLAAMEKSFTLWNNPNYILRQESLPILSRITHFSEPTIICYGLTPLRVIRLQPDRLYELPERLQGLVETGDYRRFTAWGNGYLKGYGTPRLAAYEKPKRLLLILAGNVVGPAWLSALMGAVIHSPQIIKLPHRDLASFVVFLESLNEVDPAFRKTIACGYYSSDDAVNTHLLKTSDMVVAMGANESINAIRETLLRVNPKARFIGHGFKVSFQVVSKAYATPEVAELAAWGIAAHDGNACFTPANVYVEQGGPLTPQEFAETMADHLELISTLVTPKKTMDAAERVVGYRNRQAQRRLLGEDVRIIKPAGTGYTVIIDNQDPLLTPTCQERVVIVKPVDDVRHIPRYVKHLSENLETVGLAVPAGNLLDIAEMLGAVGATNIKLVGTEYILNVTDTHDGVFNTVQPYMSDNLRWTSLNFSDTDQAIDNALKMKADCLETVHPST